MYESFTNPPNNTIGSSDYTFGYQGRVPYTHSVLASGLSGFYYNFTEFLKWIRRLVGLPLSVSDVLMKDYEGNQVDRWRSRVRDIQKPPGGRGLEEVSRLSQITRGRDTVGRRQDPRILFSLLVYLLFKSNKCSSKICRGVSFRVREPEGEGTEKEGVRRGSWVLLRRREGPSRPLSFLDSTGSVREVVRPEVVSDPWKSVVVDTG